MYKAIKWTFWLPVIVVATITTFPVITIVALADNDNWTDFWGGIADFYGDMWEAIKR